MTTENMHTTGLFAELLEGAKAVQERPTLIAERDHAKQELDFHKARLDEYRTWHDDMAQQIATLKAEVAAKEDDLKQATFREQEVRSKLETLVTSFRGVIGEVKAAADLANELVEEPKASPTVSAPADQIGNDFNGGAVNITEGNNVHPFDVQASNNTSDGTVQQDQTNTVNIPGKLEGGEFRPLASPTQSDTTENGSESTETHPQSSDGNWHTPTVTEVSRDNSDQCAPLKKPYWQKPTTMTWADWIAQGGDKASWVRDIDLDYAY